MITKTRQVKVEVRGRIWELELQYHDDDGDSAEVLSPGGVAIGRVFKGSYTYSPPLYHGSRVAREHRKVACWHMEEGPGTTSNLSRGIGADRYSHGPFQTRRRALEVMVSQYLERAMEEDEVATFAKANPDARFRLIDRDKRQHLGKVLNLHPGGLVVRDPSKPPGQRDLKVRRRAIREDRGAVLEVQLRPNARWQAVANAMAEA
jgi:hypothetical protein